MEIYFEFSPGADNILPLLKRGLRAHCTGGGIVTLTFVKPNLLMPHTTCHCSDETTTSFRPARYNLTVIIETWWSNRVKNSLKNCDQKMYFAILRSWYADLRKNEDINLLATTGFLANFICTFKAREIHEHKHKQLHDKFDLKTKTSIKFYVFNFRHYSNYIFYKITDRNNFQIH